MAAADLQERYHDPHEPLPITNEAFVGGEDPDPLEGVYNTSSLNTYWGDMAHYAPDDADIYARNESLLRITEGVMSGKLEMTGSIQDVRQICGLFFERQGSLNSMRGVSAPDRLFKAAGRYLETSADDKEKLDKESTSYEQLPGYAARLFKDGDIREKLSNLNQIERVTFGTMLQEVSYSYDNNVAEQGNRAVALRNTFENWAEYVFQSVNRVEVNSRAMPEFLQQYSRKAWAAQYDIAFARIAREPGSDQREREYRQKLDEQLLSAEVFMRASAIPTGRDVDGFLYEYFLPISIRYNALMQGQQDKLTVRGATPREDSPIDGMTHPDLSEHLEKYSFDMVLHYPQHERRVFLQTKLGRDVAGYDPGIKVFNAHTNIRGVRDYMATTLAGMRYSLRGEPMPPFTEKNLRAERLRVSSLLPDTVE